MSGAGTPAQSREETTLLCVPFAGAGPSFFHPWRDLSAGRWRVTSVELPGRERRILETPYRNVVEAAKGSVDDIVADLGEGARTVLFGHSLGAVLAYELVHLLGSRGVRVEGLVVSGSPGPWTQRERRATGLPDEEFLARVEEFAGFRHEALDHPEMRELILPVLQADCEMHENYVPSTDTPVSVPILSLRGAWDGLVTAEEGRQWQAATTAGFDYAEFPGDHMYLVDQGREVLDAIAAQSAADGA
ncbi:thioesterase II family protein [Streptomyces sp. NPDC048566]|uniref:thioesterase II family protein n=1 Tax=Streptomyces sp. NPDC048566 TaxID=3365569 RepID=UPI003722DBAF